MQPPSRLTRPVEGVLQTLCADTSGQMHAHPPPRPRVRPRAPSKRARSPAPPPPRRASPTHPHALRLVRLQQLHALLHELRLGNRARQLQLEVAAAAAGGARDQEGRQSDKRSMQWKQWKLAGARTQEEVGRDTKGATARVGWSGGGGAAAGAGRGRAGGRAAHPLLSTAPLLVSSVTKSTLNSSSGSGSATCRGKQGGQ